MKLLLFASALLAAAYHVSGQSSCATPSGGTGSCVTIDSCPALLELVRKTNRTPQETDTLQKSACGFQGRVPKVCCPQPCYTPYGEPGRCVNLYSCPHIAQMLQKPVSSQNLQFVQNSRCQGPDQYSVCCGPPPNAPVQKGQCASRATAFPPDPRSDCCGLDSRQGNKIVGGNETAIDEYPWAAIIEYTKSNRILLLCGGSLISSRYVLTAAHCVTGRVLDSGTPTNVRLGEYDTTNDGSDCVPSEGGGEDCTEPVVIIPIETSIAHPEYDPRSRRHDIGIIRLQSAAPFTDFIRPICLPTADLTLSPPTPFSLFAAGWGALNATTTKSAIKMHVDLPFVSLQTCEAAYKNRSPIWDRQLCAGGQKNKDSCRGDSGGPLMYKAENGRIFELIGVVSFGPTPCGAENIPGVYSKVFAYKDWIRSNIRA